MFIKMKKVKISESMKIIQSIAHIEWMNGETFSNKTGKGFLKFTGKWFSLWGFTNMDTKKYSKKRGTMMKTLAEIPSSLTN